MQVALILLAAGRSRRMNGRDKLMEPVRGNPLLHDRAAMGLKSHADPVIVVLPNDRPERSMTIDTFDLRRVINPEAATGMASSIKCGLAAVPETCAGALMMPADMPNVTEDHLNYMISLVKTDVILRAAGSDLRPKSPTYLPRDSFALFDALQGDEGGRHIFARYAGAVETVELDGPAPTLDLDTPEDWQHWRDSHPSQ